MSFLPFHRPTIYDHHVEAVSDAVRSGWLTSAGKVEEFEKEFAKAVGGTHAVALNSCTAALHLALLGLGIGPGDEVITSPITFASAVNVIEHVGAIPVFADVCSTDLTIDPESVKGKITKNTRLIMATSFAGYPPHMEELEAIARVHKIALVTDAAHGIETLYHGRKSGTLGSVACYSFYATKNITTGEGGMLVTDDSELAERVRILRLHGMTKDAWKRYGPEGYKHWDIVLPGWKYNMSDINAALGLAQLKDMKDWYARRRILDAEYRISIPSTVTPLVSLDSDIQSALHLFVVRIPIPHRDQVMFEMQQRGIGVGVHFRAVHELSYYREKYHIEKGFLPRAEKASAEVMSLPFYPLLELEDLYRAVKTFYQVLEDLNVHL